MAWSSNNCLNQQVLQQTELSEEFITRLGNVVKTSLEVDCGDHMMVPETTATTILGPLKKNRSARCPSPSLENCGDDDDVGERLCRRVSYEGCDLKEQLQWLEDLRLSSTLGDLEEEVDHITISSPNMASVPLTWKQSTSDRGDGCYHRPFKRVRFCPIDPHREIHLIEDRTALSTQKDALWYSPGSLRDMKLSSKKMCQAPGTDEFALSEAYKQSWHDDEHGNADVELMQPVLDLQRSSDFASKRGLERWSSQHHLLSRCMTVSYVKTEVFIEQAHQHHEGVQDTEALATVYAKASLASKRFARVLALADHAIAVQECNDERPGYVSTRALSSETSTTLSVQVLNATSNSNVPAITTVQHDGNNIVSDEEELDETSAS